MFSLTAIWKLEDYVPSAIAGATRWLSVMATHKIEAHTVSYNAIINTCASAGEGGMAEKWLLRMIKGKVDANSVSYASVIAASAPDCRRAEAWLLRMQGSSIEVSVRHFNALLVVRMRAAADDPSAATRTAPLLAPEREAASHAVAPVAAAPAWRLQLAALVSWLFPGGQMHFAFCFHLREGVLLLGCTMAVSAGFCASALALAQLADTVVKRSERQAFEKSNKRVYLEFTTKLGMHSPIQAGERTPRSYLDDAGRAP